MNIYRIKDEIKRLFSFLLFTFAFLLLTSPAYAIVDPLASPNNRFGIHIISATPDESSPAASLVNSQGGDWGYVTVLIERKDRDHDKWQSFFNDLRRRHLIPLVRLATQPEGNYWKIPEEGEEQAWADFLDNLIWPVKNRYVIIYNEPNQGQEWAGAVDPASYARVLDKTITALKYKNPDFFVMNAGFDASAPGKYPLFEDQLSFMRQMEKEVPGIFKKLDGWVSHSYPNPGFAGSPHGSGRGTVKTWAWELQKLREFGVAEKLPVFITETGWKHAEGKDYDKSLPTAETVGDFLEQVFQSAWNSDNIVAVTPFLLNYQEPPFDHFSFKKITGEIQNLKILGASTSEYYPHFQTLIDLPKASGRPFQEDKAAFVKGYVYPSIVAGESYTLPITFKNTGQSIWNEYGQVELRATEGQEELSIEPVILQEKVEPGKEATFNIRTKAPLFGEYKIVLQLFFEGQPMEQPKIEFTARVKSPVILSIRASLPWGKNPQGSYLLSVNSEIRKTSLSLTVNREGVSRLIETRELLPDYTFNFTLSRPFYKPKTITRKVSAGPNILDFGILQPDLREVIFNPVEFFNLLPFSP